MTADVSLANLRVSDQPVGDEEAVNASQNGASVRSVMATETRYQEEYGRRYYSLDAGSYYMPNDEDEQLRMSIMHQFFLTLTRGQLFLAPIKPNKLQAALDIGTGTGDWAMAMAEQFPDARIVGSDLSAIQPDAVPENLDFEIDNAEEEWIWDEKFDMIHFRSMAGAFKDWDHMYSEALDHLNPGGYIEVIDIEPSDLILQTSDTLYAEFQQALVDASRQSGRTITLEHMNRVRLEAAGFESIKSEQIKVALGPWPPEAKKKALGKLFLVCKLEGLEAEGLRLLTRYAGWSVEDVRKTCKNVQAELMGGEHRLMTTVRFITGRKPREPRPA